MARVTHRAPSQILSINDELSAFEVDALCTFIFQEHENKRDYKRLESLIKSLAVMVGGFFGADMSDLVNEAEKGDEIPEAGSPDDPFYEQMMAEKENENEK